MGFVHEGILEKFNTLKDGTVKYTVVCSEMDTASLALLLGFNNQFTKVLLSDKNISKETITEVDNLEIEETGVKSQSQRLRACLYRLWEKDNSGYDTFTLYYNDRMERIINQIKERLG